MLYLRPSKIPRAGLGLFTDKDIEKGKNIIEYTGEILTWNQCLKREELGEGGYFFYINSRYCIDAYHRRTSMGRYANDAKGRKRVKGINNNSEFITTAKRVHIVATK